MKRFMALALGLTLISFAGCGRSGENTVIEKEDLEQYNIPEGAMEEAMKKASQSTKTKK